MPILNVSSECPGSLCGSKMLQGSFDWVAIDLYSDVCVHLQSLLTAFYFRCVRPVPNTHPSVENFTLPNFGI